MSTISDSEYSSNLLETTIQNESTTHLSSIDSQSKEDPTGLGTSRETFSSSTYDEISDGHDVTQQQNVIEQQHESSLINGKLGPQLNGNIQSPSKIYPNDTTTLSEQLVSNETNSLKQFRGTVVFVGSSQDGSLISIGTAEGSFYIFSSETQKCLHSQFQCGGPVIIIETLICSSLVASVVASPLSDSDSIAIEDGDTVTQVTLTTNSSEKKIGNLGLQQDEVNPSTNTHSNSEKENDISEEFVFGCRDVQLWNTQTSARIAVICFPSKRNGRSAIIPHVVFDPPLNEESEISKTQNLTLPERHFEPIVAVKMSHRRLVIFLDCPSAEIQIFDLKTLKLIHRLERTVITVANTVATLATVPLGQQLRVGFFGDKAFFGATPMSSLAGVGCLTIHPYYGYLVVPVSIPAVDLNSTHGRSSRFSLGSSRRHPPFPVADEALVASAAAKGSFSGNVSIGCIGLVDILGEVRMLKSSVVHQNPISAIACNGAATMVVTSSVKGTIFRVWSIPSLDQLYCWRRGTRPSRVLSLSFSWDSQYVLSTSRPREQSISPLPRSTMVVPTTAITRKSQMQDDYSKLHIFLCTRGLTTLQRQRHFPPRFEPMDSNQNVLREHIDHLPTTTQETSIIRPDDTDVNFVSYPISRPAKVSLNCPSPSDASSCTLIDVTTSPSFAPTKTFQDPNDSWDTIKSWVSSIRSSAKQQLSTMMSDVIGPRLPDSLRESLINAQSCFANASILHPPIILGLDSPTFSVPILFEVPGSAILESRVYSRSGCVLTYICDKTRGGECRLISEVALIHPNR